MSNFSTTNIKGTDYRLMRLVPTKGGRIAVKVGVLLAGAAEDGDAIKVLINTYRQSTESGKPAAAGLEALADSSALLQALAGGVAKIDADVLFDLAMECVRGQLFAKQKLHDDDALNEHFANHPDHMLLVLAWALKENCSGFFGFAGQA